MPLDSTVIGDAEFSVYVRDRGVGFDPSTVEDDRHGVRGSIIGRMERHGGRAEILDAARTFTGSTEAEFAAQKEKILGS